MQVASQLSCERLRSPAPFSAWLVRSTDSLASNVRCEVLCGFVDALTAYLAVERNLYAEIFAQLTQFSNGKNVLRQHREEWRPILGLGVWADRPSPTLWTRDDFVNLDPNEKLRPLMYQLLRIRALGLERHRASHALLELGSLMQIFVPDPVAFFQHSRRILLPMITEPILRAQQFFVPLLESKSITACEHADKIRELICGASVYIRQSREDEGLLIVSDRPLDGFLDQLSRS